MARDQGWLCKWADAGDGAHNINWPARKLVSIRIEVSARGPSAVAPVGRNLGRRSGVFLIQFSNGLTPSLRAPAKQSITPRMQQAKSGLLRRIRLRPKAGFGGQECSSQ